ncbi:MAG: hybrid sensor histidine kinase/response regulator [Halioglobus sp.]|nr:hybrid sensor histidine kinase/response regulator [Halioglobus sp.]
MNENARPIGLIPGDPNLLIRAEQLDLLMRQSSRAAYTGVLMALLLAAILWGHVSHFIITLWVIAVIITGLSRLALYVSYGTRAPTVNQVPRWEAAYLAALMLYFAVWGFGGVLLLPDSEPLYQTVICYFLIGMAGSAISVFSANRLALVSSTFLVLAPVIAWLYLQGQPLQLGMALGGTAFLLSSLYAARILSVSLQQNLEMKHELLSAKREGDELTTALESALSAAHEASNAKTRFLASASHDLRQPIHSLSMLSSALSMRALDDKSQKIAEGINQSIDTLSHQLDALLDISKLDAGVVPVELADLDLYQLLVNLQVEMSTLAKIVAIDITLDCPQPCPVHSDPVLLERILRNLLSNAIAHNQSCNVVLTATIGAFSCVLVVQDSGKGIDPAVQDKIFEEFYQLENSTRDRSKGLGLGLAITRRLQALLDLDMQFESAPGQGTRFGFTLPVARSLPASQDFGEESLDGLQGLRVLVVDDETSVRDGMGHVLEELGCESRVAATAADALATLAVWEPQIVLADYRLAEHATGIDLIARVRREIAELPAYLVTGDVNTTQVEEAKARNIAILHKPVSLNTLRGALIDVLQR